MAEARALERTCIVTREVREADELIRFVLAPDGEITPDLRRRLPGHGVHVTATAEFVATAERKHLFAKVFDGRVTVQPGLADRVGKLITDAAVQSLSLARKAGTAVSGYNKVEGEVARNVVVGLIHAVEASADGVTGLAAAARRAGANPKVIRAFTSEQLDLAFGRTNAIHAALLAGPASEHALARIRDLVRYRGEEPFPASAPRTLTLDEPLDAPAGP